ncbi:nuclear transport factor 2 family protein [Sphingobium sp.]|uniref:nuclear transport factor 2 family protein n=1 Tax=Sphingobium sp. TaxID=1912891 RepID=UPI0035C70B66
MKMRDLPRAALCLGLTSAAFAAPTVPAAEEKAAAQAEIWVKEQSIYAARGRGDIGAYLANTATDYLAWPPLRTMPEGHAGLDRTGRELKGKNQEKLAMRFTGFAMNGDTAIIYYDTHRTQRSDGTPADERFEVTHTWVREDGQWKVLGGMARATPKR